jgi:hypothetical protein
MNGYIDPSARQGHNHTDAPFLPWVGEAGAWQHMSHMGDVFTGPDHFFVRVTDAQGAATNAEVAAIHVGSHPSGHRSAAQQDDVAALQAPDAISVEQIALLFNQAVNTAAHQIAEPLGFVPLEGDVALCAQTAVLLAEGDGGRSGAWPA